MMLNTVELLDFFYFGIQDHFFFRILWRLLNYFVTMVTFFLIILTVFIQLCLTFHFWLYVQVIGVWWWVFGSRSVLKVTPEVFSWDQDLSFCRPVKFFHTDWIIISLWSMSYTQRHCHVTIEKAPVQTVAIQLEAHNSPEYHYMLKH